MSKIERYAGNLRAFGSNAQGLERTLFGETTQADDLTSQVTAAFLRGWGIVGPSENPSLEDFNAAMYALSQFIAYQHQMGIPEWDSAQEYYKGSLCIRGGETYSSLVDNNIGSAPPSAKWTQLLSAKNSLSEISTAGAQVAARANLGFDAMGIGLPNNALLSAFDWQQVDFTTGARYLVSSSTWTNAPSGVNYPAGTQVFISVDGITSAGTVIELTVIANQANDANYRIYKVRIANAKGSRTFTVRQIFTSADVIPAANLDAPGRLINVKTFTSSGTYTPTAGMKFCIVKGIGGGGAGGGAPATASGNVGLGAGGNAGAYGEGQFTAAQIGVSQTVTVGSGGTGTPTSGGSGGSSSLGSLITFGGGSGSPSSGNTAPPLNAGNGNPTAVCTGANIISGTGGASIIGQITSSSVGYSGPGANSAFGTGGVATNVTGNGASAGGYGAGGGGACAFSSNATARTGGNGSPGFVTIFEYA